jgi:hypothetical protein
MNPRFINHKETLGLTFEQYQELDGFSNSYMKNFKSGVYDAPDFSTNRKVATGNALDCLLTGNQKDYNFWDNQMKDYCFKAVEVIKAKFGYLFNENTKYQVAYQATYQAYGLELPLRGLVDIRINNFVIDLKYTEEPINSFEEVIKHMGYDYQLELYRHLSAADTALILVVDQYYNTRLIPVFADIYPWLNERLFKFGSAIKK